MLGRLFDLTTSVGDIVSISVTTALLGVDFGLVAMAIGARFGSRGAALGAGSALAAASYLLGSLAQVVDWLHPGRYASLFYWSVADDQIGAGAGITDYAVLVAVMLLAFGAAVASFQRFDIS